MRAVITFLASIGAWSSATANAAPLVIACAGEFDSLNPLMFASPSAQYISLMLNRPLVLVDANWQYYCELCEKLPSLANGLAQIIDDKGKKKMRVEWHLKPGLKWGDGQPVTAKDMKLAWEIGRSPNVALGAKDAYERIENLVLDPVDSRKFTFILREPRYDFFQQTAFTPVPSHVESAVWEKAKDQAGAYEKLTTYTTAPTTPGLYLGPYLVTEARPGTQLSLKQNPFFTAANGKPLTIDTITVKVMPQFKLLQAALLAGSIDMVSETGLGYDQVLEFTKKISQDPALNARFEVQSRTGAIYEHLDFNLRNPILADVNIRHALAYGIDRTKFTKAPFSDSLTAKQPPTSWLSLADANHTASTPAYEYDAKKAAGLLDTAGWTLNADGYRYKDGKKMELSIITTSGNKLRETALSSVQADLRKLGIAVIIRNEPAREFFEETVRKVQFPAMAMYAWTALPDSPPRSMLYSKEIPTKDSGWNGQNTTGYSNAQVDKILDDLVAEQDQAKRQTLVSDLQKQFADDLPSLPLYWRTESVIKPASLGNLKITGHQFYSTEVVETWTLGATISNATGNSGAVVK